MLYWFSLINIMIYFTDRFPQLSNNSGSKDKSCKVVRGERRGRDEGNEKDFEVKGHLPLWIILPFKLEEGEDAEDWEEGGGTGLVTSWQALSPSCLFLVLIQSEWRHACLSTDWAEMQIHSESRVLIRMKKKNICPCSSSVDSAYNKEDVTALAAATKKCWIFASCIVEMTVMMTLYGNMYSMCTHTFLITHR